MELIRDLFYCCSKPDVEKGAQKELTVNDTGKSKASKASAELTVVSNAIKACKEEIYKGKELKQALHPPTLQGSCDSLIQKRHFRDATNGESRAILVMDGECDDESLATMLSKRQEDGSIITPLIAICIDPECDNDKSSGVMEKKISNICISLGIPNDAIYVVVKGTPSQTATCEAFNIAMKSDIQNGVQLKVYTSGPGFGMTKSLMEDIGTNEYPIDSYDHYSGKYNNGLAEDSDWDTMKKLSDFCQEGRADLSTSQLLPSLSPKEINAMFINDSEYTGGDTECPIRAVSRAELQASMKASLTKPEKIFPGMNNRINEKKDKLSKLKEATQDVKTQQEIQNLQSQVDLLESKIEGFNSQKQKFENLFEEDKEEYSKKLLDYWGFESAHKGNIDDVDIEKIHNVFGKPSGNCLIALSRGVGEGPVCDYLCDLVHQAESRIPGLFPKRDNSRLILSSNGFIKEEPQAYELKEKEKDTGKGYVPKCSLTGTEPQKDVLEFLHILRDISFNKSNGKEISEEKQSRLTKLQVELTEKVQAKEVQAKEALLKL